MSNEKISLNDSYRAKLIEKQKDLGKLPPLIQQRVQTLRRLPSDHEKLGEQVFMLLFETSKMLWRYNRFFKKNPFHFDNNVANFNAALTQIRYFDFSQYREALDQYIANFPPSESSLIGLESTYHYVRQAQVDEHFNKTQRAFFSYFFDQIRSRFNAIYKSLEKNRGTRERNKHNKNLNKPFTLFDLGASLDNIIQKQKALEKTECERIPSTQEKLTDDNAPCDDFFDISIEPLQEDEDAVVWMWHHTGIFPAQAYYDPVNHIPTIKDFWNTFHKHHKAEIKKSLLNLHSRKTPYALAQILPDIAHWMIPADELAPLNKKHIAPLVALPIKHQKILQRCWEAQILTPEQQQQLAKFAFDLYTSENSTARDLVRHSTTLCYWLANYYWNQPTLSFLELYYNEEKQENFLADYIVTQMSDRLIREINAHLLTAIGTDILSYYLSDRTQHSIIKKCILSSVKFFKKMLDITEKSTIDFLAKDPLLIKTIKQKSHPVTLLINASSIFKTANKTQDTEIKRSPECVTTQATLRSQTPDGGLLTK